MAPPPPKVSSDIEAIAELPGFYYDPDKNRYFPIRGPIPGAATRRPAPPPPAQPPPPQAAAAGCRKTARQPELVHAREMYGGGVIFSNKRKSTFMRQCQYAQASQPMVWKYKGTALVADKALEELYVTIQTPIGLKESKVLVTGSMNGIVRLYGLGTAIANIEDEMEFLPEPAWTPLIKQNAPVNSALASIWSSETAFSKFLSSVTCIKKLQHCFPGADNTNSSSQRALYP
uniref:Transducin/WD40 repeat-like superfamily protein n=1 Tax=Oryza nivara TaxID=4536 RepID=A0A0E0FXW7_ORYNI